MVKSIAKICIFFSFVWQCTSSGDGCLSESEKLKWNRTFTFKNENLTLKLAVTDDPTHWIVNHIFGILARERLGYNSVQFVAFDGQSIDNIVNRLKCSDTVCGKLPDVHLNLLLWLPIGTDVKFWADSAFITDYGPLGPMHNWELFERKHRDHPHNLEKLHLSSGCTPLLHANSLKNVDAIKLRQSYDLINKTGATTTTTTTMFSEQVIQISQLDFEDKSCLKLQSFKSFAPTLCDTAASTADLPLKSGEEIHDALRNYCQKQPHQAVKIAWAKLQTAAPVIHQLASRMYLTHDDIAEIYKLYESNGNSEQITPSVYQSLACRWLRLNPTKWKQWTTDWDRKLNLTITGMFSLFGKWILSGLDRVAQEAVQFVNADSDYFGNSQYSLSLDVHNLTCESDLILSDYFKILETAENKHLIGSIAALCSDSIEAVVELANIRKQIVISPTVATARFLEQQHYEYFFRTVPSMTQANFILLRLFLKWGWHRMVVFRKVDHFFDPLLFQTKGIEIIADIEMEERQLTYKIAKHTLEQLKQRNSRIFVIEYDARGTYLVLCAAYHEGMHFAAGYVWFLNPRLSDHWWSSLIGPTSECTINQMVNITSWTFTVGHQLLIGPMVHSFIPLTSHFLNTEAVNTDSKSTNRSVFNPSSEQFAQRFKRSIAASTPANNKNKPTVINDPMHDYSVYTYDAVIILASAVVHLLRENPNSISALTQPQIAERLKNLVAQTNFGYRFQQPQNFASFSDEQFGLDAGFQSAGDYYGIRNQGPASASNLRFNENNERVADYWLLKQRQLNTTVPIIMWSTKIDQELLGEMQGEDGDLVINELNKTQLQLKITTSATDLVDDQLSTNTIPATVTTAKPNGRNAKLSDHSRLLSRSGQMIIGGGSKSVNLPFLYDQFEESMSERWLDPINWSSLGGPPHDGSITKSDCLFPFLSDQLKLGCTGATVTVVVIIVVLLILFPLCVSAHIHYQRKLKEMERLTRKPFEELCAELAESDIPAENIVLNRRVGQGAFGLVYGGEAKTNDIWEAVAVKTINDKATYERKIDFLSEAKLMRSLVHPNVIKLIGISLTPKANLYLIMELMLFGDLKTYLLSRRTLAQSSPNHDDVKPATLTKMATDISQGVAYLHSRNMIHRDIACRNCLVAADRTVKIGDFGLTREAAKHNTEGYYRFTRNCELPIRWMSPEAVQFGVFSIRSDIWSYGITLYEIITFGVFPYNGLGDVEVVERVKRMEFNITEFLPAKAMNTVVCDLINQCCKHQWQHRPTSMNQVLEWLNKYPNCIRPFLTEEPPKPITTMDSLPFQPPLGSCIPTSEPPVPNFANLDDTTSVRNTRNSCHLTNLPTNNSTLHSNPREQHNNVHLLHNTSMMNNNELHSTNCPDINRQHYTINTSDFNSLNSHYHHQPHLYALTNNVHNYPTDHLCTDTLQMNCDGLHQRRPGGRRQLDFDSSYTSSLAIAQTSLPAAVTQLPGSHHGHESSQIVSGNYGNSTQFNRTVSTTRIGDTQSDQLSLVNLNETRNLGIPQTTVHNDSSLATHNQIDRYEVFGVHPGSRHFEPSTTTTTTMNTASSVAVKKPIKLARSFDLGQRYSFDDDRSEPTRPLLLQHDSLESQSLRQLKLTPTFLQSVTDWLDEMVPVCENFARPTDSSSPSSSSQSTKEYALSLNNLNSTRPST